MKFLTSLEILRRSGGLLPVAMLLILFPIFAQESATRARKVLPERKSAPPKPKPKAITGRESKEARERLEALGYWLKSDAESFRHALIAFQKVEGLKPTGRLTFVDLDVLRAANPPVPKETKSLEGSQIRIEVDLRRQVLFVIDGENKVTKILSVSSGNGKEFKSEGFARDAVTPPGRFNVYNKIKGWKKSPLGMLYYPNYYLSGLAIHGSTFVPAYPDSHGCIRIPMYAAEPFYKMTTMGTEILVYGQPETKK